MATRPTSSSADTLKWVLRPSGTPSTDNSVFADAVANAVDGDVIYIDSTPTNPFYITSTHYILKSVSIVGHPDKHGNATIEMTLTGTIRYGSYWVPETHGTSYTVTPFNSGYNYFTSASLSAQVGDWVHVYADDVITGVDWHSFSYEPRSGETMQIKEVDGNVFYTGAGFADEYANNAKATLIPMIRNITIADLIITGGSNISSSANKVGLHFYTCADLRMEDVTFHPNGCGMVQLNECANVKITGCTFGNQADTSTGSEDTLATYWLVIAGGHNIRIGENHFASSRHPVTTGNSGGVGGVRRGTVRGLVVDSNTFEHDSGTTVLDTHAEGYGTVFSNNVVEIGTRRVQWGFNCRARNTIVHNNIIRSTGRKTGSSLIGVCKGGLISADDCVISENVFEGDYWYGIQIEAGNNNIPEGVVVAGNTFTRMWGPALRIQSGQNCRFEQNRFGSAGSRPNGASNVAVEFMAGHGGGHYFVDNTVAQHTGQVGSMQFSSSSPIDTFKLCTGNNFSGWGAGVCGFYAGVGSLLENAWAQYNTTSPAV